jgi:hypothetical protein
MSYATLLGSALWALLANKRRSLLTVLGITIGIVEARLGEHDRVG